MVPITAVYAALLFAVGATLSFQVGGARLRSGVSILHGGDMELAERIRRHANFTENVPLALILLAVLELNGAAGGLLHGLGIALLAARIAHPLGLHHDRLRHPLRLVGALGTTLVMAVASLAALWGVVSG